MKLFAINLFFSSLSSHRIISHIPSYPISSHYLCRCFAPHASFLHQPVVKRSPPWVAVAVGLVVQLQQLLEIIVALLEVKEEEEEVKKEEEEEEEVVVKKEQK